MNIERPFYDAVVVGGGPAGATAAQYLAESGNRVLLLDRGGRIKPCGGAIPPRLIRDFAIPDHMLVAKARCARMVAPSRKHVDIPIDNGFVGMVDREHFDEWLRARAANAGAQRATGTFIDIDRDQGDQPVVRYRCADGRVGEAQTRVVIGADGARSAVAKQNIAHAERMPCVFAYHEILSTPAHTPANYHHERCDVVYQGHISPDFYGWVFPHGQTLSVGTGSANKGFSLRDAVATLRQQSGLEHATTVRREGAPIPMKPLPRWDNGRDVVLAGDAAGVVAPASGEGIYYAMLGGQLAAEAAHAYLRGGNPASLKLARKKFMRAHGKIFWVLGIMQSFWYRNNRRRERFVKICEDQDVQQLTFDAYMNKRLVRRKPMAHIRIFFKDLAHLLGMARV